MHCAPQHERICFYLPKAKISLCDSHRRKPQQPHLCLHSKETAFWMMKNLDLQRTASRKRTELRRLKKFLKKKRMSKAPSEDRKLHSGLRMKIHRYLRWRFAEGLQCYFQIRVSHVRRLFITDVIEPRKRILSGMIELFLNVIFRLKCTCTCIDNRPLFRSLMKFWWMQN